MKNNIDNDREWKSQRGLCSVYSEAIATRVGMLLQRGDEQALLSVIYKALQLLFIFQLVDTMHGQQNFPIDYDRCEVWAKYRIGLANQFQSNPTIETSKLTSSYA